MVGLVGVLIGLWVVGRRARRDSNVTRTDKYRDSSRQAVADALSSAHKYQHAAIAFADPDHWTKGNYKKSTAVKDRFDEANEELRRTLMLTRLHVQEPTLQGLLDDLLDKFDQSAVVAHKINDAFWEKRTTDFTQAVADMPSALDEFGQTAADLQAEAADRLRPTVFDDAKR